jgi:nicotinamide-nucleotide amidase
VNGEIISVGTELLLGTITDTNASFLGRELATLGIDNFFVSAVGDNRGRLTATLRRAWERSDVIVMTGGLGPTEDDLTREAISDLLAEPMVVQPDLEQELRAFFGRRNVAMPERNVKQATLIQSASALANPVGTAPGWWVERDGHIIAAMPGVPSEMTRMWANEVKPRLQQRAGGMVIFSRTLKVIGIGESSVEEMLGDLIHSTAPTVATYAKRDGIHVRLTTKAVSAAAAETTIGPMEARIRAILGNAVYGVDDEPLAHGAARLVSERGVRLAIVELGTAGALSADLIPHLGDAHFAGASVHPLPEGPAAQTALAVATEALAGDAATHALAVAIEEIRHEPPAYTVHVAVAGPGQPATYERAYNAALGQVRQRAVNDALNLLRQALG